VIEECRLRVLEIRVLRKIFGNNRDFSSRSGMGRHGQG
jgi:hypothetical protein